MPKMKAISIRVSAKDYQAIEQVLADLQKDRNASALIPNLGMQHAFRAVIAHGLIALGKIDPKQ